VIRDAVPADRPALLALQSLLPEPAPEALAAALDGPGEVLVATGSAADTAPPSTESDPGEAIEAATTRRAPDCERPVGYVFAMPGEDRAYIAELVVAPAHRRQGIASALFTVLFERLRERDVELVTLAVAPDNDASRTLYENWGFQEVDRDPDYYDGDPAVLLARPL
jgi:ribosomal-protein-alanine N-acetyltransferase